MNIETFSYNHRSIDVTYGQIFRGITLPLRKDCNGSISIVYNNNNTSYIYVTNYHDFVDDYIIKKRDIVKETKIKYEMVSSLMKGLQFDVTKNEGYIFNSYNYIKNSLRQGGFSDYSSK
jgi:hypothetical protein